MLLDFILIALGFGNLAMLGWLVAACLPLLIHLWSRHRYRETSWAAMQFLLAAMRKNARRLQLQQWLLLALRMLLVALVVFAAAEPYGSQLVASASGEPVHKVLVLDGSYSMAYRDNEQSRFERAKQLAAEIVRNGRSADQFTVILMAQPARVVGGRQAVDRAQVAAQIETLPQNHTAADFAATMSLVHQTLEQPRRQNNLRQEVHFFTDLQRATWTNSTAELSKLAQAAEVYVVDLGQPATWNTAVTSFSASETIVLVDQPTVFDVNLHQFGQKPRKQCVVELLVDDVPVAEQSVDIAAGADCSLRFTHRFRSPGWYKVAVRAADDHLNIDNTRWLVLPVREHIPVLCVAGYEGAARYVVNALEPNLDGGSPIRPEIVAEGDLAEVEFTPFDCILLCNVSQLAPREAERLKRYISAGGGLVFFLGDRVLVENYNALAAGDSALVPARIGEVVKQSEFRLDPLNYRHPIVAVFRGQEQAGLLTTPVSRYYRLEIPQTMPDRQIALATSSGDPLIVTAPLGSGQIVLVATDASLDSVDAATGEPWTYWPTWPSFLPIVREVLAFATSGQQRAWQQLVGTPITYRANLSAANQNDGTPSKQVLPRIVRPDGGTDYVSLQPAAMEWVYPDTLLSGIYSLIGLSTDDSPRFAVNVDSTEGDLAKMDPRQFPAEVLVGHGTQRPARDGGLTKESSSLSAAVLWIALVLLFVEPFLAWVFGRGFA
jgi:hypothetical protein